MGSARPTSRAVRPKLHRLLATRTRAAEGLGLDVPRRLTHGPDRTLARRIATLDRWIAGDLDAAGGKRLPAWDPDEDGDGDDPEPIPAYRRS